LKRHFNAEVSPCVTRSLDIPPDCKSATLKLGGKKLKLTNLDKIFWAGPKFTKRDLLEYYASIADALVPHLANRAMVMKRYPNGAEGEFFFMKRVPSYKPDWLGTCTIPHRSGNIIDFAVVDDLASLLWVVNTGCIDLNQWYGRCDDYNRPDYLHFDLDPGPEAPWDSVLQTALVVRDQLREREMPSYAKTTGSSGIHIYVPIVRGPLQKEVWTFAKAFALEVAAAHAGFITSEYRIANRPPGHVLVDYNQNAWGRTLASVYSVRPSPMAAVSTPVTWEEIESGIRLEDFRLDTVPARVANLGDLFAPVLHTAKERVELRNHLSAPKKRAVRKSSPPASKPGKGARAEA
jgi:bifunctional non-homologous end joining protein LigD